MVNSRDVNPYDAGASRRYAQNRKSDRLRKEYVDRAIERLKFEYGSEHINPYDLGQIARIREIFKTSKELYRKRSR